MLPAALRKRTAGLIVARRYFLNILAILNYEFTICVSIPYAHTAKARNGAARRGAAQYGAARRGAARRGGGTFKFKIDRLNFLVSTLLCKIGTIEYLIVCMYDVFTIS